MFQKQTKTNFKFVEEDKDQYKFPINEIRKNCQLFQNGKLAQIQQYKSKKGLFLMGDTRSGKSTSFLLFKGQPLISIKINRNYKIQVERQSLRGSIIGHGGQSKTKIPNFYYSEKHQTFIIDCPGLNDNKGFQDNFLNKFYIMTLFKNFKQARFELVIPQDDIKADKKKPLSQCVEGFLKYFNLENQQSLKKIISHTSLIISKVQLDSEETHQTYKKQFLLTELIKARDLFVNENKKHHKYIFEHFINNLKNIHIFQKPSQMDQKIQNSQILEEEALHQFAKINYLTDIDFKFKQIKNNENPQKGEVQLKSNMNQMSDEIVQNIKNISKLIMSGITQVQSLIETKNLLDIKLIQKKFKLNFKKFVKQNDIYEKNSNTQIQIQKRKGYLKLNLVQIDQSLELFKPLIFLQNVNKIFVNYLIQQNSKNRLFKIIQQFIVNFYDPNERQTMINLAYILLRNFEEHKIIQKIFPIIKGRSVEYFPIINIKYNLIKIKENIIKSFQVKKKYEKIEGQAIILFLQNTFLKIFQVQHIKSMANIQKNMTKQNQARTQLLNQQNKVNNQKLLQKKRQVEKFQQIISQKEQKIDSMQKNLKQLKNKYQRTYSNSLGQQICEKKQLKQKQITDLENMKKNLTQLKKNLSTFQTNFQKTKESQKKQSIQKTNQANKKFFSQKRQINLNYQYNISKIAISIAKINFRLGNYYKSFTLLQNYRQKMTNFLSEQKKNNLIRSDTYIENNYIYICLLLGDISKNYLNIPQLAIEYFKIVKQEQKIRQIYEMFIQNSQNKKNKRIHLENYAKFLFDIGEYLQAQKYLKKAKQLFTQADIRTHIATKIQQYQKQGPLKRQKYIDFLNIPFDKPNQNFISQLKEGLIKKNENQKCNIYQYYIFQN